MTATERVWQQVGRLSKRTGPDGKPRTMAALLGPDLVVLLLAVAHLEDNGRQWTTIGELAVLCGQSPSTSGKKLARLAELNWLRSQTSTSSRRKYYALGV